MNNKVTLRGATRVASCLQRFPKQHLLLASMVGLIIMGMMVMLPSDAVETRHAEIPITIDADFHLEHEEASPPLDIQPQPFPSDLSDSERAVMDVEQQAQSGVLIIDQLDIEKHLGQWRSVIIKPNDNLSALFSIQKLGSSCVHQISSTPKYGKMLSDIRPGEELEFRINHAGELTQLRYVKSKLSSIFFDKADNGYVAELITIAPDTRLAFTEITIENSLFLASQKAGLSHTLTMELAAIFGWDVDFVQDIRKGDKFSLLYEEKYLDGEKLNDGDILAASFTNRGKTYKAVQYTDKSLNTAYYTPDGRSMKKVFLRTPVEFTRISSRFDTGRLHPIFKTKRPHRAVDYAAPMNTPIKAAGDGRVKFTGWKNGYGNVVFIQHPNNIVTIYAHANKIRKGLKKGQRVSQGQIIAYVGKTGWATGPHLHYEFRINGVHRDPVTVKLPDAEPIDKKEMANFKKHSERLIAKLSNHLEIMLASKDTDTTTTQ